MTPVRHRSNPPAERVRRPVGLGAGSADGATPALRRLPRPIMTMARLAAVTLILSAGAGAAPSASGEIAWASCGPSAGAEIGGPGGPPSPVGEIGGAVCRAPSEARPLAGPRRAPAGTSPGAAGSPGGAAASGGAGVSERSVEVLRFDCASRLGRREVTLFGNGTIRLRDGPIGKEWMGLAELAPDELQGTLRRLAAEDLSEASHGPQGVVGDWVEKCDLVLELPGRERQKFYYGRYDTLSLGLFHVQQIAEELGAKVAQLRDTEQLPERYEPRLGDVLKRTDGMRYRVVNFTSDRKGVELDGIDQPLHLIVLKEQMRLEFVGVVSRER